MAERYEPLTILKGKHAVVTGAASGIGFAIAEWFAAAGARVGVIDLELERAQEAVDRIARAANRDVNAFACDVADSSSVNRVSAEGRRRHTCELCPDCSYHPGREVEMMKEISGPTNRPNGHARGDCGIGPVSLL